jgi:hypothetical protein
LPRAYSSSWNWGASYHPRRCLAGIGLPFIRQLDGYLRPGQSVAVVRKGQADLDAGADRELDRLRTDDRRGAVALGAKHDPAIAGDDDEGALRGEDGARDDPQPVAESAPRRESQQLKSRSSAERC